MGEILNGKFKIRANYASSDYETVGCIEISAVKTRGKWPGNLLGSVRENDGKVKSCIKHVCVKDSDSW